MALKRRQRVPVRWRSGERLGPYAAQATQEETMAFAWVECPDKSKRDAPMQKMMTEPRMAPSAPGHPPMPFDGKRMIFGGLEQVVEVKVRNRAASRFGVA